VRKPPLVVGIDLSDTALRVAARPAGVSAGGAQWLSWSFDAEENGDPVDPGRVGALLAEAGAYGGKVRITLGPPQVQLRRLMLPRMPEEEMVKALPWQVEKEIPWPVGETLIDYYPLDVPCKGPGEWEILVAAVRRADIEPWAAALREGGYSIDRVEVVPCTLLRAWGRSASAEESGEVGLLHVNQRSVSWMLWVEGKPWGVRVARRSWLPAEEDLFSWLQRGIAAYDVVRAAGKGLSRMIVGGSGAPDRFRGRLAEVFGARVDTPDLSDLAGRFPPDRKEDPLAWWAARDLCLEG
jgi:Tfp pilus assembly PilM family ATPase